MGLSLLDYKTWMDEGVVVHVRGGKGFSCKVGSPITDIVMLSRDEATFLAIQCVAY